MKRLLIESGIAAIIFFAANAVYGIDALIGRNLASARDYATALIAGPRNLQLHLGDIRNMRLPAPLSLNMADAASIERSFCLAPEFGHEQVRVHLPNAPHALMSDSIALPYELNVMLGGSANDLTHGNIVAADCHGKNNVKVRVSLDESNLALVRNRVFTDTVTLVVDPE